MISKAAEGQPIYIASPGHVLFALSMIWLGALGLSSGTFSQIWQPAPKWVPARDSVALVVSLVSLAGGIGLLWRRSAGFAARAIVSALMLWILFMRLPNLFYEKPLVLVAWTFGCTSVMMAAAWVLYARFASDADRKQYGGIAGAAGVRIARVFFGLAFIPFGLAHFMYLEATTVLIPNWLPWHNAFALLTGSTFIAGGIAMIVGPFGRLAATMLTIQVGLFSVIVWIPRIIWGPELSAFQRGEFVTTCVLTAACLVMAESYRGQTHRSAN